MPSGVRKHVRGVDDLRHASLQDFREENLLAERGTGRIAMTRWVDGLKKLSIQALGFLTRISRLAGGELRADRPG